MDTASAAADFSVDNLIQTGFYNHGINRLKYHANRFQKQFKYDHATGGKLPRNHDWRPYRFCIQDVLFGATVVRHNPDNNRLDVDVFLTSDIPEYDPLAGAMALAAFLLSEAYKCGGTMEVHFTKEVEDGHIPKALQDLASQYGIKFKKPNKGVMVPEEAKKLYASLTGFSSELMQKMLDFEEAGRLKVVRACYVVHHGVWTKEQVEMIVLGSEHPDRILGGFAKPIHRHLYNHDLQHARAALLGGMLDRVLQKRERIDENSISFDLEDDVRQLDIKFDGNLYSKIYCCQEELIVPWAVGDQNVSIESGVEFNVLVRARDSTDMKANILEDISTAGKHQLATNRPTMLLLPRDFYSLPDEFREEVLEQPERETISILVSPDQTFTYDADAAQKLAQSRIIRQ